MSANVFTDQKLASKYLPVMEECRKLARRVLKTRYSRGRLIGANALQNEYAYAEFLGEETPNIAKAKAFIKKELDSTNQKDHENAFYGPDKEGLSPESAAVSFYKEHESFLVDELGEKIFAYLCLPYIAIQLCAENKTDSDYRTQDSALQYDEDGDVNAEQFLNKQTNEALAELFVNNPIERLVNDVCGNSYSCKALGVIRNSDNLLEVFLAALTYNYIYGMGDTGEAKIVNLTEKLNRVAEAYNNASIVEYIHDTRKGGSIPTEDFAGILEGGLFGYPVHAIIHKNTQIDLNDPEGFTWDSDFYSFLTYLMLMNVRCFESLLFDEMRDSATRKDDEDDFGGIVIVPAVLQGEEPQSILLNRHANISDISSNFDTYFAAMLQVCAKATTDAATGFLFKERMLTAKAAQHIVELTDRNNPLRQTVSQQNLGIDERIAKSLFGESESRFFSTANEVFSGGRTCPIHFNIDPISLDAELPSIRRRRDELYTVLSEAAAKRITAFMDKADSDVQSAIVPIQAFSFDEATSDFTLQERILLVEGVLANVDNIGNFPFIQRSFILNNHRGFGRRTIFGESINISYSEHSSGGVSLYLVAPKRGIKSIKQSIINSSALEVNLIEKSTASFILGEFFDAKLFSWKNRGDKYNLRTNSMYGIYGINGFLCGPVGRDASVMCFSSESATLESISFVKGLIDSSTLITKETRLVIPVVDAANLPKIMSEVFWDISNLGGYSTNNSIDVALVLDSQSVEGVSFEDDTFNCSINVYTDVGSEYGEVKSFAVDVANAGGYRSEYFDLLSKNTSFDDANFTFDIDVASLFVGPYIPEVNLYANHIWSEGGYGLVKSLFPFNIDVKHFINGLDVDVDYETAAGFYLDRLFDFGTNVTTTNNMPLREKTLISLKEHGMANSLKEISEDYPEESQPLLKQLGLQKKKGKLVLEKGKSGLASVYAFLYYNYLVCRCDEHFIDVFDGNTMASLVDALEMTSESNKEYGYTFQKLERAFANNMPFVLGKIGNSVPRVPEADSYLSAGFRRTIPNFLFDIVDFYTRPIAILEDIYQMRDGRGNPFVHGESIVSGVLHNTGKHKPISIYTDALNASQPNADDWSLSKTFSEYGSSFDDIPLDVLNQEIEAFYKNAVVLEFLIIEDLQKRRGRTLLTDDKSVLPTALHYRLKLEGAQQDLQEQMYADQDFDINEAGNIEEDAFDSALKGTKWTAKTFPKAQLSSEFFNTFSSNVEDAFSQMTERSIEKYATARFNLNRGAVDVATNFEIQLHCLLKQLCKSLLPYSALYDDVEAYLNYPEENDSTFFNDISPQSKEIPKVIDLFSNPDFTKTSSYKAIAKPRMFGDDLTTVIATKNSGISYVMLSNIFSGTLKDDLAAFMAPEKKKRLLAHELLGALSLISASRKIIYQERAQPEEYGEIIYETDDGYKIIQTHATEGKLDTWDVIHERAKLLTRDHGGICIGQGEYYARQAAEGKLQIYTIMSPDAILAVVGINENNVPTEIKAYRNKTPAGLLPSEKNYKTASKKNILTTTKFVIDILKANEEKGGRTPVAEHDLHKLMIAAAYHMGVEFSTSAYDNGEDNFLARLITGVYDKELNKYGDYSEIKDKIVFGRQ